jgi:hypothetical protein
MRQLAAFGMFATLAVAAVEIPSGTDISVRLGQTISSDKAKAGDVWEGTLSSDILVGENILGKKGDLVHGKVVDAQASGRLSGTAYIQLQLTEVNGVPVNTNTISTEGSGHKGRDAKAAGGGAVAGAVIGAIAGGGVGAVVGAAAGAGAGTAGAAATGKKDVKYPVETVLTFTTR